MHMECRPVVGAEVCEVCLIGAAAEGVTRGNGALQSHDIDDADAQAADVDDHEPAG